MVDVHASYFRAMLALCQISGIIILFSTWLYFTFNDLIKVGPKVIIIGVMGVVVPFVREYFVILWMDLTALLLY